MQSDIELPGVTSPLDLARKKLGICRFVAIILIFIKS